MMRFSSKSLGVYTRATPIARRLVGVVFGNDAACDDGKCAKSCGAQFSSRRSISGIWLPERIDRPMTCASSAGGVDDFVGGQADAFIGDVHAAIARTGGDLFGPVGVAVKPGLADKEFQPAPQLRADQHPHASRIRPALRCGWMVFADTRGGAVLAKGGADHVGPFAGGRPCACAR